MMVGSAEYGLLNMKLTLTISHVNIVVLNFLLPKQLVDAQLNVHVGGLVNICP